MTRSPRSRVSSASIRRGRPGFHSSSFRESSMPGSDKRNAAVDFRARDGVDVFGQQRRLRHSAAHAAAGRQRAGRCTRRRSRSPIARGWASSECDQCASPARAPARPFARCRWSAHTRSNEAAATNPACRAAFRDRAGSSSTRTTSSHADAVDRSVMSQVNGV